MAKRLDALRRQILLDRSGGMDRGVVPVQEPVLGRHDRPFRLENFKKSSQGLLDVFGVHGFALGDLVRVNYALRVEEDEDHFLGPGRVDFCFSRAWQTLLNPLFGRPLRFRGVEGYGRLVHGHNVVQERQRMPPKKRQEVAAASHPLLHLLRRQKLGDPMGGLLNEAQIFLQDGVNGANRKPMRGGKFPSRYLPVFLNGGGDGSQNVAGPLRRRGADQRCFCPP